jgi:diguanylate cyclase (GGDEF)-like protein
MQYREENIGGDAKARRLYRSVTRTQLTIGLAYLYDFAMLCGFYLAGYIEIRIPLIFLALIGALFGGVALAHRSGWSARRSDPTLFLPQQLATIAIALIIAMMAPQIGFQPFATLFAISAFSFMAPNTKSLVVCWIAAAAGAVGVIFLLGPRLAVPTSTLSGQALTGLVVIGLLARCIWIATFFRRLQTRLTEKNRALNDAFDRIAVLATHDDLTGLANRRAISTWLDEQIRASQRSRLPLTVAILDIDHFKRINDTYGHVAGDRVLQSFSTIAAAEIRETDRLGRYGGEEFLVVLTGSSLENAKLPLERIRERLAERSWDGVDEKLRVTITIGATQYTPGESVEALIRRADAALYLGKGSGRDQVVLGEALARDHSDVDAHAKRDLVERNSAAA